MKQELEEKLFNDFPLMYADVNKSMQESCMYWGCECGSGWYEILRELSSRIEPIIQKWIDENGEEGHPRAAQVKEKFGRLVVYMDNWLDEFDEHIEWADKESLKTCENCGKPGKLGGRYWLTTLCDDCRSEPDKKW